MNAADVERFMSALQAQKKRGSVALPEAPAQQEAKRAVASADAGACAYGPGCPSRDAMAGLLPAARDHALEDMAVTEIRLALDAIICCETRMSETDLHSDLRAAGAKFLETTERGMVFQVPSTIVTSVLVQCAEQPGTDPPLLQVVRYTLCTA